MLSGILNMLIRTMKGEVVESKRKEEDEEENIGGERVESEEEGGKMERSKNYTKEEEGNK